MKKISLTEELQKETERLTILVEEAIKNGIPMIQDEAVMAQNRKVDDLVVKVQKELEQNKKGYLPAILLKAQQEGEAEFMNGEPFPGLKVITIQDENRDSE